jgi:hypothetical protein
VKSIAQLMNEVTYWFGVFGHQRDGEWKGILAVPLDAASDARARAALGGP